MVECPEDFVSDTTKGVEEVSLSEVKKMKRKANKAKAQEDKSRILESQAQNTNKRKVDGELDVIDPEPLDPQKLLSVKNPIEEAVKFIRPVLQYPCKDAEAHLTAFNVYYHKGKSLLMLRCLKKAKELDRSNPAYLAALERYKTRPSTNTNLTGTAAELAEEITNGLVS